MADQNNPHFRDIFWYIIMITVFSFGYITAVTFIIVPEKNQRTVDTVTGFLLGSLVAAGVGYLLGGNPSAQKPKPPDSNVEQMDVAADNVNVEQK